MAKALSVLIYIIILTAKFISIVATEDMSAQILLPKDITIRQFAICFENEDIPPTYGTTDGPVKDRNSKIIKTSFLKSMFKPVIKKVKLFFDNGSNVNSINRTVLDANYECWRMIATLLDDEFVTNKRFKNNIIEHDIAEAEKVSIARVGTWVTDVNRYKLNERYSKTTPIFYTFYKIAKAIEDIRDRNNEHTRKELHEWKRDGQTDDFKFTDCFAPAKSIRIYQVGSIIAVKIIKRSSKLEEFIMTNVHLTRVIDYFKTAANLAILSPDIYGLDSDISKLLKILRFQAKIALKTPNGVGGVMKSARQILFLRGDRSRVMGSSPESLYISGLDGMKESHAEKVADFLYEMTSDRKSAINLANIFRIIPHPDQDMKEVFETVEGFKEANPVDYSKLDRFEGMVRKAVYESLSHQKIQVRAKSKDDEDQISRAFVNKINSTSTPTSSIISAGFTKWCSIEFENVRGIFDADNQDIPVSNKSSAPDAMFTVDEVDQVNNIKTFKDFKKVRERLRSVNDILSRLKMKDDLEFKSARSRFRSVIKAHREFEIEYLKKGVRIDDIPSEDLEKFVKSSPDHSYTVCTEPKLGEVHKEVTRLFYMAQQALKVMTQVCERFTKKVISKSSGISIVKDFRARRKELEAMLDSYNGVAFDDEGKVIFISFDMSEFSKKFPQSIVRIIGKVLSELSGEDWMARIDVFFRASIVYHSSRGFVGAKTGVKGGFEGFLNFLWTLAMKVVMDIATQSTGVTGVLAVYSDDGLLRLYIDGSPEEVRDKVIIIQKVFRAYGLIFHMDKTVASSEILEYLGVYGDRGTIIANWIKEAMSIGKRKKTKGVETIYDKMTLLDSQCAAIIKANGPTYAPFLIKTILGIFNLRRIAQRTPSSTLAVLTAIPYSAGGFRMSSISENSILSSIESLSEFCADLELMRDAYPNQVTCIMSRILDNMKMEKEAELSLLNGSLLQTNIPDTSGISILKSLLERANIDGPGGSDPITTSIVKKCLESLRSSRNIPIKVIQNMIQSIPDVIEYNKNIAIMKSDVALKFLKKSEISHAQYSDTKICKESISEWNEEMCNESGVIKVFNSMHFANMIISKIYPSYDICVPRESPRTALRVVRENAMINTAFEITKKDLLSNQEYKEPEARFLGAQLSPEYTAESAPNTKQRRFDRFVAVSARLVASNASLIQLYYIVANAFKLPCPTLPSSTVISAHRSSTNFGMSLVNVFLTPPFHALISATMTNLMWRTLENRERADRTTYVESARVATYLNIVSDIDNCTIQNLGVRTVMYNIRDLDLNTSNPTFSSAELPDDNLIDTKATKSFTTVLVEEVAQSNFLEGSIATSGIMEVITDKPVVKGILLSLFEKWLYSCIMGNEITNRLPPSIPDAWKVNIYSESCVNVAFKLCGPSSKRVILRGSSELINKSAGKSIRETLLDANSMQAFQDSMNYNAYAYEEFEHHLSKVGGALSSIDIDNRILEQIGEYSLVSPLYVEALISFLKRKSVTGGSAIPTVIINTDTFADSKMSRNVRNAVKDAVDSALNSYLEKASNTDNWTRSTDANINFLYILKNMIRSSGHRNTPFNKHMFLIQLIKFELFVTSCINEGIKSVNTRELDEYRIQNAVGRRIVRLNAVIGGRTTLTTGEDMRKCLFNEGIPSWCIARVNYILYRLSDTYSSYDISIDNIMHNPLSIQGLINYVLDTYESIVKTSVQNLEIRHRREAERVGKATVLNPVDEVSLIVADIDDTEFVAFEEDVNDLLDEQDFSDIIMNLIIAHSARWKTEGYRTTGKLARIMREFSLIGTEELSIRDHNQSPFNTIVTDSTYTLSVSSYLDEESAVNNYLYANRLFGGMAVIGRTDETIYLFSILPVGTSMINTHCNNYPIFYEDYKTFPPIYTLRKVLVRMRELSKALGIRRNIPISNTGFGSLVVQQAYQRLVGARGNVEDEDKFLVAMAEVVSGAWSMDISYRVLGMFAAWYSIEGDVTPANYVAAMGEVHNYSRSEDGRARGIINRSASAVWTWIRLCKIQPGPNIDTNDVNRIVSRVSRSIIMGGTPMAFFSTAPRSIANVKSDRGRFTIDEIINNSDLHVFTAPPRNFAPMIEDDIFEDFGDDEDW